MKIKNQDKLNKIISIILLISWVLLIFYFSNQKGSISEENSNFIINILNSFIKINNIKNISYIIRKLAHIFLYFILYYLTYYVLYQFNINKRKIISFIFCILFAISDEFHQLFIINRSGSLIDVFIDTIGSYLAYFLLVLKSKLRK